jgi:hypothetical protein
MKYSVLVIPAIVAVAFLIFVAIFMACYNRLIKKGTMGGKELGYVDAMALTVLLGMVGALLFKSDMMMVNMK